MVKVAIVDDERTARQQLAGYVKKYADASGIACEIRCFENALTFLNQYKQAYDLILLDIEMPELSGMELAERLRKIDTSVAIIFVTNMAHYAIRGYQVDASDFIVKPVSYGDFAMKAGRVFKRIRNRGEAQITVCENDMVKRIAVAGIRYLEVQGHTLTYHTLDGDIAERGALKKWESVLLANGFARCNNYCLVNLRFVSGVSGFTVFVSQGGNSGAPDELTISHPRKKEFVRVLNEFWQANI